MLQIMPKFFISYSRVDLTFVEKLYTYIQEMRPNDTIWYDKAVDGLLGGDLWWDEILDNIAKSDIFIYVLSNESVESIYCQAEFKEARRLQKRIIPIQARDRTKLTDALSNFHYVDMKNGVDDQEALENLRAALDRQISLIHHKQALWQPRTQKPSDAVETLDTSTEQVPVPNKKQSDSNIKAAYIGGAFLIAGVIIAGLFGLFQGALANRIETLTSPTIAQIETESPTNTSIETPPNQSISHTPIGFTLFRSTDYLIVYIPDNVKGSLADISFKVTKGGIVQNFPLDGTPFTTLAGFDFSSVEGPYCFVLERDNSAAILPLECSNLDTSRRLIQRVASPNVFWFDDGSKLGLLLIVMRDALKIGQCPGNADTCKIDP